MPRFLISAALVAVTIPLGCSSPDAGSFAGDAEELSNSSSAAPSSWPESAVVGELQSRIETARDKFIQMAEAVPEAQWDYRPMEGVRSFGEVFIHIAADNWAPAWAELPMSVEAPIETSMDALREYQAEARPKDETLAELESSFAYLLAALDASRGRMDQVVMFGGREWELGEMWIALTTHMHEHLGQSIAYARANEIVPPWSR